MIDPSPAINWLLAHREPAVRYLTLTEVLDRPPRTAAVRAARAALPEGAWVAALLAKQAPDGGFGVHPYQKWGGAHWRLVSLVELRATDDPGIRARARAAAQTVLRWLTGPAHRASVKSINGLTRRCASQEGNALAVCSRLGPAEDPRVRLLANSLVEWQWPDGGWNCRKDLDAHHASFHESLPPLWGLWEYQAATGDLAARAAAERGIELFLRHRLFRSDHTGAVISDTWLKPRFPPYWHYDVLQGLLILARCGALADPRAAEALDWLEARQDTTGLWRADGYHWAPPGKRGSNVEVVDWGRGGPNAMLTLNALRVLKAAGRLRPAAQPRRTVRAAH